LGGQPRFKPWVCTFGVVPARPLGREPLGTRRPVSYEAVSLRSLAFLVEPARGHQLLKTFASRGLSSKPPSEGASSRRPSEEQPKARQLSTAGLEERVRGTSFRGGGPRRERQARSSRKQVALEGTAAEGEAFERPLRRKGSSESQCSLEPPGS
jgi:hypothetical protein